jgi:hypothetical protein
MERKVHGGYIQTARLGRASDDVYFQFPIRVEFWVRLIQSTGVQRMAEIGVYRGDFVPAFATLPTLPAGSTPGRP